MYRTIGLFILSSVLSLSCAFGETSAATAELLLRKSGTWEQLGGMERQVMAGFGQAMAQARPTPSAAEAERLAKLISRAYATAALRSTAVQVVMAHLDERHLPAIVQWYDSATGRAITRLEEQSSAASSNEDPGALASRGMDILQKSSEHRRQLIADLVRETRAAGGLVEMTLNVALAIQRGVLASNPDAPGVTAAELRAALEQQRPAMLQAYERIARASYALMYEALSDAELEQYVAFCKSPAGAHFVAVSLLALDRVLSTASEELGKNLAGVKDQAHT